jgi:DNA mismatch repair protein MutS
MTLIDLPATTRRNLELTQTLRGDDSPTLFSLLDTCMTGMGSRTLKRWLLEPRASARLPATGWTPSPPCAAHRGARPLAHPARASQGQQRCRTHHRAHRAAPGAAARAVALRLTLQKAERLMATARWAGALLTDISGAFAPPRAARTFWRALLEEPAALVRDGGVIASGLDAELDELRAIQTNCDAFLLDLETREKARTGIANLRVQFNKVHGFYIEVTKASSTRCRTTTAAARR